jgi:diguanylate cyclase (GGDEF)-like protein
MTGSRPRFGVRRAAAVALGLVLVAVVGWVDSTTGRDYSVAIFYLPAVFVAAWYGGSWAGLLVALAAATTWLVAFQYGRPVEPGPFVPVWNALVILGFFLVSVAGVAKLKEALSRERALSREDPTTGVANGRAFAEAAAREIERARRSRRPLSLVFADCDDFKAVNDRYGHLAGDEALGALAHRIRGVVREVDIVARLGGDEFAVLLPETDAGGVRSAVERMRAALRHPLGDHAITLTLSMGLVTFSDDFPAVEEMLRDADVLMYAAKNAGKDTFRAQEDGRSETPKP